MPLNYTIYGFIISFAILVCFLIADKRSKVDGKNPNSVWDIGLTTVLAGLAGARAYHVADYWNYYSQNYFEIFNIWKGGMGIWGALIGGLTGLIIYLKLKKDNLVYWCDLIAGVLPVGQSIGRWGNYFNQENYGLPTQLPWKIFISSENRLIGYENEAYYHPIFFYESILNLILFFTLTQISKKYPRGQGFLTLVYIAGYSLIRYSLDFLRIQSWTLNNLNVSQTIAVVLFATTTIILFLRIKKS